MKPFASVLNSTLALSTSLAVCFLAGCVTPDAVGDPNAVTNGGSSGSLGGAGGAGTGKTTMTTPLVIDLDASLFGGGGASGWAREDVAPPPPTGDANCGSKTSDSTRQPADVLLVLDRSGSMNYSTAEDCYCTAAAAGRSGTVCSNTSNCNPRWPALTSAIDATLTANMGSINWGLKLYSSPNGQACTVNNGVEVPIASTSVPAIQTQIGNVSPANNTPTAQAITAATTYLKTVTDTNGKFILLATDGEPNCGGSGTNGGTTANVQGTIDAITAAKAAGFSVYVIGIGPSVGNLDSFAAAGGTTNYFPASSPQALTDAFASISKLVATCVFTSTTPPPDPNNIAVYLNKGLVTKDDVNGWSFGSDTSTVILNGTSCTEAMAATGSSVQILFGCPGGPPPPSVIP